jgi:hypothetical protein
MEGQGKRFDLQVKLVVITYMRDRMLTQAELRKLSNKVILVSLELLSCFNSTEYIPLPFVFCNALVLCYSHMFLHLAILWIQLKRGHCVTTIIFNCNSFLIWQPIFLFELIPRQRSNIPKILKDICNVPVKFLEQCNTFLLKKSMLGWEQPT